MSTQQSGSIFVAHLSSYPSVKQAVSLVKSFSVVQKAEDISKPYVEAIGSKVKPYTDAVLSRAQPTLERADQLGDKILGNIDSKFPSIKTVQPSDVISEVKHRFGSAKHRVESGASSAASSIKSKYSQVYDTNGKPYVEGLENRIAPLNDKIESAIDEYLPGNSEAPASNGELSRSYSLFIKALSRVKPVAFSLRDGTLQHVQSTYNSQIKTVGNSPAERLKAAVNTGVILGKETVSKLYEYLSGTPTKIQSVANTLGKDAQEEADKLSKDLKNETDKLSKDLKNETDNLSKDISSVKSTATQEVNTAIKNTKAKAKEAQAPIY